MSSRLIPMPSTDIRDTPIEVKDVEAICVLWAEVHTWPGNIPQKYFSPGCMIPGGDYLGDEEQIPVKTHIDRDSLVCFAVLSVVAVLGFWSWVYWGYVFYQGRIVGL